MTKVTDEMLMAFVDGELEPAAAEDVRRATANDAALAKRAASFRSARQVARDAFAEIKTEPVPDSLIAAVFGGQPSTVVAFSSRRRLLQTALPLAASIAILFGLGGYWLGQHTTPDEIELLGGRVVAQALGGISSGSERTVRAGNGEVRLRTLVAYKVDNGLCRTFEMSPVGSQGTLRGVGCNRGAGWHVEVVAAQSANETYAPASAGAAGSIDAYLDALDAQGPLNPDEEAAIAGSTAR